MMPDRSEPRPVDVVIVGGGFSGLAAADTLAQAGRTFTLLEAQPTLGGRAQTRHPEYGYLDLGAAYIGEQQNFLNMYVQRFGIETLRVHLPEHQTWIYQHSNGRVEDLPGDDPYVLPGASDESSRALLAMYTVNQLSIQVRALGESPWRALNAHVWDHMTVAEWLERTLPDPSDRLTRELFGVATRCAFSAEPEEISFLWFLHYAGASGCFQNLVGVTSDPEGLRFKRGSCELVDALASAVGPENIRLGEAARSISQDDTGVTVSTDRHRYRARRAIVCMSPANSLRLEYRPALGILPGGSERVKLAENMPLGAIIKAFVHFERAFWRDQGRSGYALLGKANAPLSWTLDNCWEPADGGDDVVKYPNSLMCFIVGANARHWSTRSFAERREAVISQLVEVFGAQARSELVEGEDYHEKDWSQDEWAGGGPCGNAVPRILTTCGEALRRPIGRLHWACTEAATEWCGYLTGALESGIATASEIVTRLSLERGG